MATKAPAKKAPAKKASAKKTPAKAITDAAVGLEHDVVAALRDELKHLRATLETIEGDVRAAVKKIEKSLDDAAKAARKQVARKVPAKKAPAKKAPAKKAGARK